MPRGRSLGAMVATCIGLGWWLFALTGLPRAGALAAGAAGLGVVLLLLGEGVRRLRSGASRGGGGGGGGSLLWVGFALVALAEVAGLNLALWLLRAPSLRAYWIAAISLVVGLHFVALARLFRRGELLACAAAMLIGAALAAGAIAAGAPAVTASALEGAGNAVILWATAAYSLRGPARRAAAA